MDVEGGIVLKALADVLSGEISSYDFLYGDSSKILNIFDSLSLLKYFGLCLCILIVGLTFACAVQAQSLFPLWDLDHIDVLLPCLLFLAISFLFRVKELVLVGYAFPLLALVTFDF